MDPICVELCPPAVSIDVERTPPVLPQICNTEKEGDILAKRKELKLADEEDFGSSTYGKWRSWLWNTMEYPWTSDLARYGT